MLRLGVAAERRRLGGERLGVARGGGGNLRARTLPGRLRRRGGSLTRAGELRHLQLKLGDTRAEPERLLVRRVRLAREARGELGGALRGGVLGVGLGHGVALARALRQPRLRALQSRPEIGGVRGGGVRAAAVRRQARQQAALRELRRAELARHADQSRVLALVRLGVFGVAAENRAPDNLRLEVRLQVAHGVGAAGRPLELLRGRRGRLLRGGRVRLGDERAAAERIGAPRRLLRLRLGVPRLQRRNRQPPSRRSQRLFELLDTRVGVARALLGAPADHLLPPRQARLRGGRRRGGLLPGGRARVQRRLGGGGAAVRRRLAGGGGARGGGGAPDVPLRLQHQLPQTLNHRRGPLGVRLGAVSVGETRTRPPLRGGLVRLPASM